MTSTTSTATDWSVLDRAKSNIELQTILSVWQSVLNVKAVVGTFNQEKAILVVAVYVIVKTNGSFAALSSTDQAVAVLVVLVIVGAARPALGSRPAGVEDQQGRHRQPSHILTYTIIGPQS